MLLKEVRDKGRHRRLLFKVLIEEDALIISAKGRENEEPVLINIGTIIGPYADENTIQKLKESCRLIYLQKAKEEKKLS